MSSPISKNRKIRVRLVYCDTSETQFHSISELTTARPEQKHERKVADPAELEKVKCSNIQDTVEPYHSLPYEAQIKDKQQSL
jgi:hypothetical protein